MTYIIKSNHTGDYTENIVKLDLIRRGWVVLEPSSRDMPYDLVVETGSRDFKTIQVKSISGNSFSTTNRGSAKAREQVSINGKLRHSYSYADENIDWMVGVKTETMKLYYYPIDVYSGYGDINVTKVVPIDFPVNSGMISKRNQSPHVCNRNSLEQFFI